MIKRIFVEKKDEFEVEAKSLTHTFQRILKIQKLESMRIVYRYDVQDVADELFDQIISTILSEPNVDQVFEDCLETRVDEKIFGISYLPGQYDQHADSAIQCIQIVSGERALVKVAKIVVLTGELTQNEFESIKHYMINPVDSQEASLEPFTTLADEFVSQMISNRWIVLSR